MEIFIFLVSNFESIIIRLEDIETVKEINGWKN